METQTREPHVSTRGTGVFTRKQWWTWQHKHETDKGLRPDAFDFVSIHWQPLSDSFGLCSPMCLVDGFTGKRPHWEWWTFPTFADAMRASRWIARQAWQEGHHLALVWCPAQD